MTGREESSSLLSRRDDESMLDSLTIGRRVRQLRMDRGLTLDQLGSAIGRAASQVSVIENGKRELRIGELQGLAGALGVDAESLIGGGELSRRNELEIALEKAQRGPVFRALGLDPLPLRRTLSEQAIETILALHDELQRVHRDRAATPEEARRVNTQLRRDMRAKDNYLPELERMAQELLDAVGHTGGPLSQRVAADIAGHLGFSLHHVTDLPSSTRSLTDLQHRRIYLPVRDDSVGDPRSGLLQALASNMLGHGEPADYAEFLRHRVETRYLAAALMVPEMRAVTLLAGAKSRRELSVEDLRDAFAVSYETAAHRFTNLATKHLGIPVHFLKVHESGTLSKAYENDDVRFPTDPLGAVEGQIVCRYWSARRVFDVEDRFSPYHQFTDKPTGTYWCTSSIQTTPQGHYSVSLGTSFLHSKWFRGADTTNRFTSTCPDENCCRTPPASLAAKWARVSLPSARLNSSLFAAMPGGVYPGVDTTEAYEFLEAHAPRD
jgi:predicted transcriptional regulator